MTSWTKRTNGPKHAAIVGLGWWGQHILRQTTGSEIVRVVRAVGSRDEHRARAEKYGVTFTTDFAGVLADRSIDLVILATPHAEHARQIEMAARAGKHVFCEKPVGLSVEEVRRSMNACRAAGIRLGVGHERRFEPAMEELRKLVVDGSFGTIMHVEAEFHHDKLRGIAGNNWRVSEQGGVPLAMTATGIHLTDLFIDLIGPIETVTAFPATRMASTGYDDTLSVHVGFASKATGYFSTVLATPFYSRLTIFGSEAWAEVRDGSHPDEARPSTLAVHHRDSAPIVTTLPGRDAVRANLEQFALSIDGEAPYPFTEEQIAGNIAVMAAVSRSMETARTVSLSEML
ncbi:Gfo/Idh/MocA family protein [Bradyrhizobium genosp. P]|uniref:Gfo/Idh/MocA family protein n=1 Tax=Bradyrhizobium genosp. P TaxID=83641 RepID=UPI003CF80FDA